MVCLICKNMMLFASYLLLSVGIMFGGSRGCIMNPFIQNLCILLKTRPDLVWWNTIGTGFYLYNTGNPDDVTTLSPQSTKFVSILTRLRDFGFRCSRWKKNRGDPLIKEKWCITHCTGTFRRDKLYLASNIVDMRRVKRDAIKKQINKQIKKQVKKRIDAEKYSQTCHDVAKWLVDEYNRVPGSTVDDILVCLRS